MSTTKRFTNATGAPVADNTNIMTAGPRGPALLQGVWLIEKTPLDDEILRERASTRMHRLDAHPDGWSPIDTKAWHPSGSLTQDDHVGETL